MDVIHQLFAEEVGTARPLHLVTLDGLDEWLETRPTETKRFLEAIPHTRPGGVRLVPGAGGDIEALVVLSADPFETEALAGLPQALPAGVYRIDAASSSRWGETVVFAWGRDAYTFRRRDADAMPRLVWPAGVDRQRALARLEATWLVRDLINAPPNEMGPEDLQQAVERFVGKFGAQVATIQGEDLLSHGYSLVHAIGRESKRIPRLIDLRWGETDAYKLTLVGKGVCFDSGGYNIKSSPAISHMKVDMGGAAQAIGLAHLIMSFNLPIRLRLLIPAVDNAIGGGAVFPGDTIIARNGKTIEIFDTDAEGRVILADALVEASSEQPDLLVDFATLTSAARIALGPDVQALFCNDDTLASELIAAGAAERDYLWQLPLHAPYQSVLKSAVADLRNYGGGPLAGAGGLRLGDAIHAALFLEHFVEPGVKWAHFDIMGVNFAPRPGRQEGGEAVAIWAILAFLEKRLRP